MANLTLYELTAEQERIETLLVENGGELTPEIEAELNGNTEALTAKVDGYQHILARFEASEDALDKEIKRLTALKRTAQNAKKSLKSHLTFVMQEQGLTRLEGALCKVSLRRSEAVELADDFIYQFDDVLNEASAKLPPYVTIEIKPSKTDIMTALKNGEVVNGAGMVENYTAVIR